MRLRSNNVWDSLSEDFDTYKPKVFHGAADNILIAWPVILKYIKKNCKGKNARALDFGCGTGMFCNELFKIGFKVFGIDISKKMVAVARKNLGDKIQYSTGDYKSALRLSKSIGKFDLITSVMVFQFVMDIEDCIGKLAESLKDDGCIIFAVHDPIELNENNIKDKIRLGRSKKPVTIYQRNSKDYDIIFKKFGFKNAMERYPKANNEFLKKYPQHSKENVPKYIVIGYKKSKNI